MLCTCTCAVGTCTFMHPFLMVFLCFSLHLSTLSSLPSLSPTSPPPPPLSGAAATTAGGGAEEPGATVLTGTATRARAVRAGSGFAHPPPPPPGELGTVGLPPLAGRANAARTTMVGGRTSVHVCLCMLVLRATCYVQFVQSADCTMTFVRSATCTTPLRLLRLPEQQAA